MSTDLDKEILEDFIGESKSLIDQLMSILEEVEGKNLLVYRLEEYGQIVDRIMGGVKNIALSYANDHPVHKFANYAQLCKLVGYKASQIDDNPSLFDISVAFLLDATEMLQEMTASLLTNKLEVADYVTETFLGRLRWLSNQYDAIDGDLRTSVAIDAAKKKQTQAEVDALLKKLGIG